MKYHIASCCRAAIILLFISGFMSPPVACAATAAPIYVACVRESITRGDTLKHRLTWAWPAASQKLLGAPYRVVNFGFSGATVLKEGGLGYRKKQEFDDATQFDPNAVIITLGSNDTKTNNLESNSTFKIDTQSMTPYLGHLTAHLNVYICTPPPLAQIHWHESEGVLVRVGIPQKETAAAAVRIPVVHIYDTVMKHIAAKKPIYYHSQEGLRPNPHGEAPMAKVIYHQVIERWRDIPGGNTTGRTSLFPIKRRLGDWRRTVA
jgi:sialate O-acetylesterase